METIDVIIAEDEFFTREGIARVLEQDPGIRVVAQASGGEEAITLVEKHQPTVLLLDLRMPPGIDGLEVIKRLRAAESPVRIVALTAEKRLVEAVEAAGGNGFVPKEKYGMLSAAVRCVAGPGGKIFINPDMSRDYQELVKRVEAADLSEAEWDVWRLIAYKNDEIGRRLFKTVGRIRNLVTELYFKLDIIDSGRVSQKVQAIELARRYGILEEPVE